MSDSLGVLCTACVDIELVNERRLLPASLASKMKDYVSPYAQSGESKSALSVRFSNVFIIIIVRKKSATVQRKSTTASIPKVKQRGMTCSVGKYTTM